MTLDVSNSNDQTKLLNVNDSHNLLREKHNDQIVESQVEAHDHSAMDNSARDINEAAGLKEGGQGDDGKGEENKSG